MTDGAEASQNRANEKWLEETGPAADAYYAALREQSVLTLPNGRRVDLADAEEAIVRAVEMSLDAWDGELTQAVRDAARAAFPIIRRLVLSDLKAQADEEHGQARWAARRMGQRQVRRDLHPAGDRPEPSRLPR